MDPERAALIEQLAAENAETLRDAAERQQRSDLGLEPQPWQAPPATRIVRRVTVPDEPAPADPDERAATFGELVALADESGGAVGRVERRLDALAVEMEQRMGALAQEIPPATGSSPSAARLARELRLMVQTVSTEANKNYATLRDVFDKDKQSNVARLLTLKEERQAKQYDLEQQVLTLQRDVLDLREALRGRGSISVPARGINGSGGQCQ